MPFLAIRAVPVTGLKMAKKLSGPAKLPVKQLAILAICRFAEPVAMTSVFPYLPEMIESFGVGEKNVAKWAGITSGIFSLAQCFTAIIWGRSSDALGRKPTILMGLTCTMLATLLFGASTTLPMAIIARALAGACNGNVGIIRTMVAEMVPEKELQPRAFSIMPLVWSMGSIFGPSFGGFFAKPAQSMPGLFGNSKLLIRFPFLLPNLVASVLFLIGITTGILFLHETLETKRHKKDYGRVLGNKLTTFFKAIFRLKKPDKPFRPHSAYDESSASLLRPTSAGSEASKHGERSTITKPIQPQPTLREVFTKQSVINLIAYTFLALHSVTYDQLLPIFMHHPRQVHTPANTSLPFKFSGGFGLKHGRIGTLFTMYGICGCFIQFLIFPPVARKFGVLNCYKACSIAFPIICFITPYTALIVDPVRQQAAMFGIMIIKSFAVIFAFPCSIILLTNSAVSLRILGTLNGLAVSFSAVGKALGPAFSGAAFSWGIEIGYVITQWWLLGIIAIIGAIPIWFLVEMEGFSPPPDDESDSESLLDASEQQSLLRSEEAILEATEEGMDTLGGPSIGTARPPLSRTSTATSHASAGKASLSTLERRMSSPIGLRESIGPGGGRRLSNALAASNSGHGTGGQTFA